jgi:hypothetical protein
MTLELKITTIDSPIIGKKVLLIINFSLRIFTLKEVNQDH